MTSLLRLAACAGCLGLFFVGALTFCPAVLEESGLDFTEWVRCRQFIDRALARSEELEHLRDQAIRRVHTKDQIARDLIAGRIGVVEAATRYGDLPYPPPRMWEMLRMVHGGASDEETMCRHIISWTCQLVDDEPARTEALRTRLESEMQAHLRNAQNRQ
jgi:hypothetical protein